MKTVRIAATALTAAALVATTAASAQATPNVPKPGPWSPWTAVPKNDPFVAKGYCSVPIKVQDYVQREVQRTRTIPGGTEIEIKGKYVVRLIPFNGSHKHYDFDASGSEVGDHSSIAYDNGDFLFRGTGANFLGLSKSEQKTTGLPPIAITYGPEALFYIYQGSKANPPFRVDLGQPVGIPGTLPVRPRDPFGGAGAR